MGEYLTEEDISTLLQRWTSLSEEDISTLLQRYTAMTVLALLQEVAHCPDAKIDWNALVKNTSTGISNAREYQMLWRHLAYRHDLLGRLEYGAHPLDDDSDLEYDVDAFPTASVDESTEAAACVKVLIASGLLSECSLPANSIVEAPLTINIPNGWSSRAPSENSEATCSMQGTNITIPVSLQKTRLPAATPVEGLDANGSASIMPPRRKRKPWSEAEDMELIAAVQKCGEGNWANISRGGFEGYRTATQLYRRWAVIRKRYGNLNVEPNSTGSQLSKERRAANHAMSLAIDMPIRNIPVARPAGMNTTSNSVLPPTALPSSVLQVQDQPYECSNATKSSAIGSLGSMSKSQSSKKPKTKPLLGSDSALKATAVAAGDCIAASSDAGSFIKATQAKSAVHLKPTDGSSTKLSMSGGVSTLSDTQTNVRYICPGLEVKPCSSYHAGNGTNTALLTGSVKDVMPTVEHASSSFAIPSNLSLSEQANAVCSTLPSEVLLKQEVMTAEEIKVSKSGLPSKNKSKMELVPHNMHRKSKLKRMKPFQQASSSFSSLNMKTAPSDNQAAKRT